MTPEEYQQARSRTAASVDAYRPHPNMSGNTFKVLHGMVGLASEGGEMMSLYKKAVFYGKRFDTLNLKEEVGDALWFIGEILEGMGWTFEEVMEANIAKLKARHPDKFDHANSENRNVEQERLVIAESLRKEDE